MLKFKIYTFGCKANQYDSALLENMLAEEKELIPVKTGEIPDFLLVNTCTVTDSSDSQARQLFRKLRRAHPESKIFALGCYGRVDPKGLNMPGIIDGIIDDLNPSDVVENVKNNLGIEGKRGSDSLKGTIRKFPNRTRSFIKVQDGCDSFCSYCIVPFARGRSRSMPYDEILEQLKIFGEEGYKEVVLTGIHLGLYGKDLGNGRSLLALLKTLEDESPVRRIRLSSIEPDELEDDLVKFLSKSSVFDRHLHIPMQSGDDEILKRMGRKYSKNFFREKIFMVHELIPDCGIGTDIIVGFPGEGEANFTNTLNLISIAPFSYLHVFPFSKRKGTKAFEFKNDLSPKVVKERCKTLRELGKEKKIKFRKMLLGKVQSVLIESKRDKETGFLKGFSRNYVSILIDFKGKESMVNKLVDISIEKVEGEKVFGKLL